MSIKGSQHNALATTVVNEDEEKATKPPANKARQTLKVISLCVATVAFGIGSDVSFYMMGQVMPGYPLFLMYFTTLIAVIVLLIWLWLRKYKQASWLMELAEENSFTVPSELVRSKTHFDVKWYLRLLRVTTPRGHRWYFWLGVMGILNSVLVLFANPHVDGTLQSILNQLVLPVTGVLAVFFLREKFEFFRILGSVLVVSGASLAVIPFSGTAPTPAGMNSGFWVSMFILGILPNAVSNILQQRALLPPYQADIIEMLFWSNLWVLVGAVVSVPLVMVPKFGFGTSFDHLIRNQLDAFECYFAGAAVRGCHAWAWTWPLVFVVFYLGMLYFSLWLVQEESAIYQVCVSSLVTPGDTAVFSWKWLVGSGYVPIAWNTLASIAVIFVGIWVYKLNVVVASCKGSATMTEAERAIRTPLMVHGPPVSIGRSSAVRSATISRTNTQLLILEGSRVVDESSLRISLKLNEIVTTIPTVGFNVETIEHGNIRFTVWDVGARDKARPLWRHYFSGTHGFIWVVDSNDRERLSESAYELQRLLREEELATTPFLIICTKQDLPSAMSVEEVKRGLGLESITAHKWHIVGARVNEGVDEVLEGLDWLSQVIAQNIAANALSTATGLSADLSRRSWFGWWSKNKHTIKSEADTNIDETMLVDDSDTDAEFLEKFRHRQLPRWDHRAHLRLTYTLLRQCGRREGVKQIFDEIKKFTAECPQDWGVAFHFTLTYFWIQMVDYAIHTSLWQGGFGNFLKANKHLTNGELFLKHYSKNIIDSPHAATEMVFPDIQPLPSIVTG